MPLGGIFDFDVKNERLVEVLRELENPKIFETPEVVKSGGLPALKAFGKPVEILHKVKEKVFIA